MNGNATPDATGAGRKSLIRRASSLLVVRDGSAGMEVLMLRRVDNPNDRSAGAFVFPGGTLDAQDGGLHGICAGLDDAAASARLSLPGEALDYYVAAVRECFEEAGLFFAYDAQGGPVPLDDLDPEHRAALRHAVSRGGPGLAHACETFGLRLAVDQLAYHSHWLTPPGMPKRFDTRFFVAVAPAGQTVEHDPQEAAEYRWVRPSDAIAPGSGMKLVPVTRHTLAAIAHYERAQDCVDAAHQRKDIVCILPRIAQGGNGSRPVLPHEPAYPEIARIDPEGEGHARFELLPGAPVKLSERVWRVTANNGSVMTGPGTNTYFVGDAARNEWIVIDPGPDDAAHLDAVLAAAPGPVKAILCTHTHIDHSPGARRLKEATGAPVMGMPAPDSPWHDTAFAPERVLAHGDVVRAGDDCTIRVVHTPGHASNHLCFLLEEERTLFTGDHIMQGSTVVISPPDGDMLAYLKSLEMLLDEDLEWLAPGHGFLIPRPHDAVRTLMRHRLQREAKVVNALRELGPVELPALLARVYDDVPAKMHPVAQRSLLAHVGKLVAEGRATESNGVWWAVQQ